MFTMNFFSGPSFTMENLTSSYVFMYYGLNFIGCNSNYVCPSTYIACDANNFLSKITKVNQVKETV